MSDNDVGTIGYIHYDIGVTYWAIQAHAVNERARELGIALSQAPAATATEQAAAIRRFIDQKIDTIIVGPVGGSDPELVLAAQEALAVNIPVIATGTSIENAQITCTIGSDNLRGGEVAAAYLVEQLDGQAAVALIDSPNPLPRIQGFRKVIDSRPGCQIVFEKKCDWTGESAAQAMSEALETYSELNAIYAASDPMALAALDVIIGAGRADDIVVVGFDGVPEACLAIYKGMMQATIDQSPFAVGCLAVDTALKVLQGETVQSSILVDTNLITTDNVVESVMNIVDLMPYVLKEFVQKTKEQRQLQQEIILAQEETLEAQKQIIHDLSTLVIPIMDQIIVMPLVGSIDSLRARDITRSLLAGISRHRAKVVILDVTGVGIMDTGIVNHLNKTIQAARLKGAQTIVTGISDVVAESIVDLGIDWSKIATLPDLQTGLMNALHSLGVKIAWNT